MNLISKKKSAETDPVNQPVLTQGIHGEKVVLTPFVARQTEGDQVEGFVVLPPTVVATPPKPRFEIKGVIRIS